MRNCNGTAGVPDVELMYVGSVLPDEPAFHTRAFSRAGSMFQVELLTGLMRAGIVPSKVLSMRQIESFPRSRTLWVGREEIVLKNGQIATLLPFVNVTPIKQFVIGVAAFLSIVRWGWRTRCSRHRVVYAYNLTVPPGLFILMGARLAGATAVASLNDINVPGQTVPDTLANRLDFWLHRVLIPRFDGHVVVADSIIDDFAPERPYLRIEGGVTPVMLSVPERSSVTREVGASTFEIVAVGTLNEANGFRVLLDAFRMLAGRDYRLCIAGSGPLEGEVRAAAQHDPRICFCGAVSLDKVLSLYGNADVLINMRLTKGVNTKYFFPSKMMEYMASGTPVITTCTGHVAQELAGLAYFLTDESALGLAKLIGDIAALDSSARRNVGAKAREYMREHKTWEVQGNRVAQYIRSTLMRQQGT